MSDRICVWDLGACGDGIHDDYEALQRSLDAGAAEIEIPQGIYCVSQTLKVHSNTHICADKGAKLVMKCTEPRHRNDFLLTNADTLHGNENISITGGIWDGNNRSEQTRKPDDLFDQNGYSGTVINFAGVTGLTLRHMVIANSTTYYVRMNRVENFHIEDISFISDRTGWNQDGLHFGGSVRHGTVKDIRALSYGQTNDDMIALNADDSLERVENLDGCRDAIEDISFENIYCECCHCIIRMLSVTAPIRNIRFKNVFGGYRNYAVNGDAARYCRTPLFQDADHPEGVGCIEHIEFENFRCHPVKEPLSSWEGSKGNCRVGLMLETRIDHFHISGFHFVQEKGGEECVALRMKNTPKQRLVADGRTYETHDKSDIVEIPAFNELLINRL